METTISNSTGFSERVSLKQILLICGILSSLLYAAMMITIQYEGYSLTSQVPSELSAIGAPTRSLWIPLGFVYTVLMIAFGLGVWVSDGSNRALRVVGGLLLFTYGVLAFVWPFAPMHQREVLAAGGGTFADTLHVILGMLTVLSNLLIIGFGAAAFGKRFRFYSIVTIIILLVFGTLTGLGSPRIQANLPTPWVGVWERITILAFLLWLVVLAIILLKSLKVQDSINATIPDQR